MSNLVCKTVNLAEKIRYQMQAVKLLTTEISGTDKRLRSKYIRDFMEEFTDFEEISSYSQLVAEAREAEIIYVGDYHALDKYQKFHVRLLEDLADRPLVLAVEMLYGRNQRALDSWMKREIDDDQFLRRVRYVLEWGYNWESYRSVLEAARNHGIPVFAVDFSPRNDLRYINKRDKAIAAKIFEIRRRFPDHTMMVLFGESHLASNHLPQKIRLQYPEGDAPRDLTVLQNIDEIYWKVCCDGFEDERVVKLSDRIFCVFNATPFEKYDAYSRQLEVWKSQSRNEDEIDLTSTIYNLINAIADFIRIDSYTYCLTREGVCLEFFIDAYPEIYCFEEFDDFESLLESGNFTKTQVHEIIHHTMRHGSCYVPRINAIFIGKLNIAHGAEEAAHFVNFALKRQRYQNYRPRQLATVDAFYLSTLEEALGYFGSKLIDSSRNQLRDSAILNCEHLPSTEKRLLGVTSARLRWMRRFILKHKEVELNYMKMRSVPKIIGEGVSCQGRSSTLLFHELGYLLGEQLYRGYLAGTLARDEISQLFHNRFEEEGHPLEAYLSLVERLKPLPIDD